MPTDVTFQPQYFHAEVARFRRAMKCNVHDYSVDQLDIMFTALEDVWIRTDTRERWKPDVARVDAAMRNISFEWAKARTEMLLS